MYLVWNLAHNKCSVKLSCYNYHWNQSLELDFPGTASLYFDRCCQLLSRNKTKLHFPWECHLTLTFTNTRSFFFLFLQSSRKKKVTHCCFNLHSWITFMTFDFFQPFVLLKRNCLFISFVFFPFEFEIFSSSCLCTFRMLNLSLIYIMQMFYSVSVLKHPLFLEVYIFH